MHSAKRLLVFLGLYIAGNLLASIALVGVAIAQGLEVSEISEVLGSGDASPGILRIMLWIQALFIFIFPAVLFGIIFYRGQILRYFRVHRTPELLVVVLGIVVMLAGQSLVLLSYEVNNAIPLPDWMRELEQSAADVMAGILQMESTGAMLHTFLLVAVLPAIGEELVFRGIVQRQFGEWFKSEVAAIWVTAIIFSAVHMQFAGFLPRMVLGALLGYLYYWSRNLWIPIVGHMINNGIPIVVLYFTGTDLTQVDAQDYPGLSTWSILFSIVVLYFASVMIKRKSKRHA